MHRVGRAWLNETGSDARDSRYKFGAGGVKG